jgi:hypothetical protein
MYSDVPIQKIFHVLRRHIQIQRIFHVRAKMTDKLRQSEYQTDPLTLSSEEKWM